MASGGGDEVTLSSEEYKKLLRSSVELEYKQTTALPPSAADPSEAGSLLLASQLEMAFKLT